jgi:hypothetical protein
MCHCNPPYGCGIAGQTVRREEGSAGESGLRLKSLLRRWPQNGRGEAS